MKNIYVINSPITGNYSPANIKDVKSGCEAIITFPGHLCQSIRPVAGSMESHFAIMINNTESRLPTSLEDRHKPAGHSSARNNPLARFSRFLAKIKPYHSPHPFKDLPEKASAITRFAVIEKNGIPYRMRFSFQQKMFFLYESFKPDCSIIQVAKKYDLQKTTLFCWKRRYEPAAGWESIINTESALGRPTGASSTHAVTFPIVPMDNYSAQHASHPEEGTLPISALFSRINNLRVHLCHRLQTNISLIKSIYFYSKDDELYRQQLHLEYHHGDKPRHEISRCVLCRLYAQYHDSCNFKALPATLSGTAAEIEGIFQHAVSWHALSLKLIALLEHENDKLGNLHRVIVSRNWHARKKNSPLDLSHRVPRRPFTAKTGFQTASNHKPDQERHGCLYIG